MENSEQRMTKVESNLDNMYELLLEIKNDIRSMNINYVPRNEVNEMFKNRDEKINKLEQNAQSNKQSWPAWAAVAIAAIALLVPYLK